MNDKLWDIKIDENEMPCLEIYHQSSATTSGKANGIEIIIDLGSYWHCLFYAKNDMTECLQN